MRSLPALCVAALALGAVSAASAQVVVSESVVVPQTTFFAPTTTVVPQTTFFAPTTTTWVTPTPTVTYFAPTTTWVTPAPVFVTRPLFVPGQPVRNTFRAVFW